MFLFQGKALAMAILVGIIILAGCTQGPQVPPETPVSQTPTGSTVQQTITTITPTEIPRSPETGTIPASPGPTQAVPVTTVTPVTTETTLILSYQAERLPYKEGSLTERDYAMSTFKFQFRSRPYSVNVPYNRVAFTYATNTVPKWNKQREKDYYENKIGNYTYGITVPVDVRTAYYTDILNDPSQEYSYQKITDFTRKIRTENNLDDNEYAEMIAWFIQTGVPYYSDPDRWVVKYPIETIGGSGGDCDDKALLLAAILAREGYGVALIEFPDAHHMIVGILGDRQSTEYDGYLGIEPTFGSYIGFYHTKASLIFETGREYADFTVLKVSDGKKITCGRELKIIWDKWVMLKGYSDLAEYIKDFQFIATHIDSRHMVYEYLTKTGTFA